MSEEKKKPRRMVFPVGFLRRALHSVSVVSSMMPDGDIRPHLYGVHIRQRARKWRFAATNGHWMLRIDRSIADAVISAEDAESEGDFTFAQRDVRRLLIELAEVEKATCVVRGSGDCLTRPKDYAKRVKKWPHPRHVLFDLEELEVRHFLGTHCLPEDDPGSFPRLHRVTPRYRAQKEGRKATMDVGLNSGYLAAVHTALSRFTGESPSLSAAMRRLSSLRISMGPDELSPIELEADESLFTLDDDTSGSQFRAIIMPVRVG